MYIFEWGVCGFGKSKHKLFGQGEEFTYYKFGIFKLTRWKDHGMVLEVLHQVFYDKDSQFLEYLPQMEKARENIREDLRKNEFCWKIGHLERDLENLKRRNTSLNSRCSDLTNENDAFRKVITVLKDGDVEWNTNYGFPDEYIKKEI